MVFGGDGDGCWSWCEFGGGVVFGGDGDGCWSSLGGSMVVV